MLEGIVPIEEVPAVPKKKWSRRKKVIVTSIPVALILILVIFVYIMATHLEGGIQSPLIITNKSLTSTDTIWTVSGITHTSGILKSEVYVQVKNAAGVFRILTSQLGTVNGIAGFNYTPHPGWFSNASCISVGDVISLNITEYAKGSTITLVNADSTSQYCIMTV